MESIWALGLMSGTSLDGIDAALIRTDGETMAEIGPWLSLPYGDEMRETLSVAAYGQGDIASLEKRFTELNAEAVKQLLAQTDIRPNVIGFHGQTIEHRPDIGVTRQIGDGALLAAQTGIDVVNDFRSADMAAGGQGAPLVPLFHKAMAESLPKPLCILNIGGIANVTYISERAMLAFDTGPGNGLMNQLAEARLGKSYDEEGKVAARGRVDESVLKEYLANPYFSKAPPKSLDRHDFTIELVKNVSDADAMATLLELSAQSIAMANDYLPQLPEKWIVCGGGVHNKTLMHRLKTLLGPVENVQDVGWQPDAIEAQAFGFLAVRSLRGLPLTLPPLTGARHPALGGVFYRAAGEACS